MEKQPLSRYIWMGGSMRYLVHTSEAHLLFVDGAVMSNIESLRRALNEGGFAVTAHVAEEYSPLLKRWKAEKRKHSKSASPDVHTEWEKTHSIGDIDAKEVRRIAHDIETTLIAEARTKTAFIVKEQRFPTDKLLDDVGSLMGSGVYEQLSPIAQGDLRHAGQCLAFKQPTAAAFHLMRATEAVLRTFYCAIVRTRRIPEPRMWAAITTDLSGRRKPIPKDLKDNLDHVRQNFRNPTQHPDKVYDLDEAQELFASSVELISRMIRHQNERSTGR